MYLELLARTLLSSSTCQFVLHLLPLILFCQRGCLSLCPLRVVSLPRHMRPHVAPPSAPHSWGSTSTSPAPRSTRALFLLFTRCVSAILSLYASILAFPVKVLSMIVLSRSRHSSSCGFVALPCDASAAQPGRPPVCPRASMSADKTWNLLGSNSGALSTTILGNGSPAPSLSAVTLFVNVNSGATICHGVPHKPSKFVDSQAPLSVCLVQLLPRTTPFLVMHKTAPVRSR